jgi:hypothetical protein
MQRKVAYARPKVVGPFPVSYASGSYVHQGCLLIALAGTLEA